MTVENFDYQQFAASMKVQCFDYIPDEFSEEEKDYIANTLDNFCTIAGEALVTDEEAAYTEEQAMFIIQVVAEWTFHKAVDLIKSDIPKEYWDNVLQTLAFTAFEVTKTGIIKEKEQEETLNAVEYFIKKDWKKCIEELYMNSKIDLDTKAKALKQSNIDELAEQAKENVDAETENQTADDEAITAQKAAEMVNNKGCAGAVGILLYISALVVTFVFVMLAKVLNIDFNTLNQIKHISFFIGTAVCFIYSVCVILQHFKNIFAPKTFCKMSEISKNILFYTGCLLLASMWIIGIKITGLKSSIGIVGALAYLKLSAIATINNIKYKQYD